MATYLQLVNEVLARLREPEVAAVNTNVYSTLIGKLVNDAKRQVESAWNWDCLYKTLTITTSAGVSTYTVTGSGRVPKDVQVNDSTNGLTLQNVPRQWIIDQQQLTTVQTGIPVYYAWNGTDGTDSKIEFFPTPDGTYSIKVNAYVPQADLSSDSTVVTAPCCAIVAGAYARAIVERGEDGGLSSGEAYGLYKGILADQIALDSSKRIENNEWVAV